MRLSAKERAVEALAEAWASIDGKLDSFHACKNDPSRDKMEGYYQGYLHDAGEMIRRLDARGFAVVPNNKQASG